jgi:hypothetical protein
MEDAYRKQYVIDNKMSVVEVIDTSGEGLHATVTSFMCLLTTCQQLSLENLAVLTKQWIRSVLIFYIRSQFFPSDHFWLKGFTWIYPGVFRDFKSFI